jgi:hypothetical protein
MIDSAAAGTFRTKHRQDFFTSGLSNLNEWQPTLEAFLVLMEINGFHVWSNNDYTLTPCQVILRVV